MSYSPLPTGLAESKSASEHTKAANASVKDQLPFEDVRSFENAARGFIASIDPLTIKRDGGQIVFDLSTTVDFLAGEARGRRMWS